MPRHKKNFGTSSKLKNIVSHANSGVPLAINTDRHQRAMNQKEVSPSQYKRYKDTQVTKGDPGGEAKRVYKHQVGNYFSGYTSVLKWSLIGILVFGGVLLIYNRRDLNPTGETIADLNIKDYMKNLNVF